jgi:hypothetical protein
MDAQVTDNEKAADEIHERWVKESNRDLSAVNWDDHVDTQCWSCVYYVRLSGAFYDDWGVCSNADAERDGTVMFEHDGCANYQRASRKFDIVEHARKRWRDEICESE